MVTDGCRRRCDWQWGSLKADGQSACCIQSVCECSDLWGVGGKVMRSMFTVLTAKCFKDICRFYSLPHLTGGQQDNRVAHALTHILQSTGVI
jgi:hypothetical protein